MAVDLADQLLLLHDHGTLFKNRHLDTLTLRESDGRGVTSTNDEDVFQSGGERVAGGITDNNNIERTGMLFDVYDGSDTPTVSTLGDHAHLTSLELVERSHLASGEVNLNGVVHLDKGVGVSDGASIVGDNDRHLLGSEFASVDTAQLKGLLLVRDAVEHETSLDVEDQSKLITGLGELDNVHESSREVRVGAYFAVNLDKLLHADLLGLLTSQSVLQSVSKDEHKRKTLSQLVRTLGRSGCL